MPRVGAAVELKSCLLPCGRIIRELKGAMQLKKNRKKEDVTSPEMETTAMSQAEFSLIKDLANNIEGEELIIEIAGINGASDEPVYKTPGYSGGVKDKELTAEGEAGGAEKPSSSGGGAFSLTTEATGLKNLKNYFLNDTEHIHRKWKNGSKIGFLLINSISDYDSVSEILSSWYGSLSTGAKVAVFRSDMLGAAKAVKEATSEYGNFKLVRTLETLTVITKDQCTHYWLIDSDEVGTCKSCGRKRNFRKLMKKATSGRGGRKKKAAA